MKKCFALATLFGLAIFVTGCHHMAQTVMSPVEYNKSVSNHTESDAVLTWRSGEVKGAKNRVSGSRSGGVSGVIAAAVVQAAMDVAEPAESELKYGNAQQAVFMTSLRDVLQNNHVFNNVRLSTTKPSAKRNQAHINIFFKQTTISDVNHFPLPPYYTANLVVDMTIIDSRGRVFTREYQVDSKSDSGWGGFFSDRGTFKAAQTQSSKHLMDKIMFDIEAWQQTQKRS